MTTKNFTTTIRVEKSAKEVYNAINNVRGWWSEEIEGNTDRLNEVFDYHFEDIHRCKIKVVEMVPNEKIMWWVMENYFKPSVIKDRTEWTDTHIMFEISEKDGKTELRFTHVGLVPEYECYEICEEAWTTYIQQSLRNLIVKGVGKPNAKGKPQTESEKEFVRK